MGARVSVTPPRTVARAKNAEFKGRLITGATEHCFSRHGELGKAKKSEKKIGKKKPKHVETRVPCVTLDRVRRNTPRPNAPAAAAAAKLFALHHALLRRVDYVDAGAGGRPLRKSHCQ